MQNEAQHLSIRGLVQGVGYRASFAHHARTLGLRGWVRNRHDGSVEAMIIGAASLLEQQIAWARRGPAMAHVTDVTITPEVDLTPHASLEGSDFQILPDA